MAIQLHVQKFFVSPTSSEWEFELDDGSILRVQHDLKDKIPTIVLRSFDLIYAKIPGSDLREE